MSLTIDGKITGVEIYAWQASLAAAGIGFIEQNRKIPQEIKQITQALRSGQAKLLNEAETKALFTHLVEGELALRLAAFQGKVEFSDWETYRQVLADVEQALPQNSIPIEVSPQFSKTPKNPEAFLKQYGVQAFQGKIVEEFKGDDRNPLVLLFLDQNHEKGSHQHSLRNSLLSYFTENPNSNTLAFEGFSGTFKLAEGEDITFPFKQRTMLISGKECLENGPQLVSGLDHSNSFIPATYAIYCLKQSALNFIGIETRGVMAQLRNIDTDLSQNPSPSQFLKLLFTKYKIHSARGEISAHNLLSHMDKKSIPYAPLVYGVGHADDIRKFLQKMNVSYVVVEP